MNILTFIAIMSSRQNLTLFHSQESKQVYVLPTGRRFIPKFPPPIAHYKFHTPQTTVTVDNKSTSPEVQHWLYQKMVPDAVLHQLHLPPILTAYFPKIHPNFIIQPLRLYKWPFSKIYRYRNPTYNSYLPRRPLATCSAYHRLLHSTTLAVLGDFI